MDETKESIGAALLPAMTALAGVMLTVATWAQEHSTLFAILLGVIGTLAVGVGILVVALKIQAIATSEVTAANWALVASFLANPVVWIVAGIVALIAVIVIVATKTTWFQDLWDAAWGAISGAIQAVYGWIKSNWPLLLAILTGPVGLAVLYITQNLDKITGAAQAVWSFLSGAFTSVWSAISSAATSALNIILGPINAVKGALEGLISMVKSVIDWISKIKIPSIIGNVVGSIPGLNSAPAVAAAPSVARAGVGGFSTRTTASGGGITVNVSVSPLANPAEVGRSVVGALHAFVAAGGRMPVNP